MICGNINPDKNRVHRRCAKSSNVKKNEHVIPAEAGIDFISSTNAALLTPSPSGRGLGRGGMIKMFAGFKPLILSLSRREKGLHVYMMLNEAHVHR